MNISFQADKLNSYRFCDNVWTFILKEVEFRENSDLAKVSLRSPLAVVQIVVFLLQVDRVKIVACDAKSSGSSRADAE